MMRSVARSRKSGNGLRLLRRIGPGTGNLRLGRRRVGTPANCRSRSRVSALRADGKGSKCVSASDYAICRIERETEAIPCLAAQRPFIRIHYRLVWPDSTRQRGAHANVNRFEAAQPSTDQDAGTCADDVSGLCIRLNVGPRRKRRSARSSGFSRCPWCITPPMACPGSPSRGRWICQSRGNQNLVDIHRFLLVNIGAAPPVLLAGTVDSGTQWFPTGV